MSARRMVTALVVGMATRLPILKRLLWRLDRVAYLRALGVLIGENCRVYSKSFGSEPYLVQLGDHVHVGSNVQFITHDGGVWVLRELLGKPHLDYFAPIVVGNNVFIGNNALILPGVTIGNNVVIGAGSVVSRNIESNSIAAGIPARRLKAIEEYVLKASSCLETKCLRLKDRERAIKKYYCGKGCVK